MDIIQFAWAVLTMDGSTGWLIGFYVTAMSIAVKALVASIRR
jgi:hypothetical protein